MTEQEKFMKAALKLARKAAEEGEVPVGCVVVCDGKAGVATAARPKRLRWVTPSWRPSARPAASWAAGGCTSATSM